MATLPREPRLLPGLAVLRRDAGHLQVGLDRRAVVLRDLPEVRALLQRLTGRAAADPARGPDVQAALALSRLAEAGHLVDRPVLERCLATCGATPAERAAAAAALHSAPGAAGTRQADRARAGVRVDGPASDRAIMERVLAAGGVGGAADDATTTVLLRDREPAREELDSLVQADQPHLLVRADLDHVVVGPFVVPGRTACVRCIDAHLADDDPRRPLLLEQQVHADLPTVRDPALWQLALGWAARDVLCWLDGEEPSTWSATVRIGPVGLPQRQAWRRHPHCGCGWAELHRCAAHQNSESSLPSIERRCSREQVSQ